MEGSTINERFTTSEAAHSLVHFWPLQNQATNCSLGLIDG